jgi:peptidoglycan hydrolase-like protein with peptidoglycan-binding domain
MKLLVAATAAGLIAAASAEAATCFSDFASPLAVQSIKDVQEQLARQGYRPGKPDGRLGPQTCRAVVAYQRDAGMTPDGRVDQALQNNLHFGKRREGVRQSSR